MANKRKSYDEIEIMGMDIPNEIWGFIADEDYKKNNPSSDTFTAGVCAVLDILDIIFNTYNKPVMHVPDLTHPTNYNIDTLEEMIWDVFDYD